MRMRKSVVAAALLAALLALTACGGGSKPGAGSADGAPKPKAKFDELVVAFRGDADTLDPHMRAETTSETFQAHIFNYLVHLDRDGKLQPDLAETWERKDEITWILHLKKGVTFHDGSPMTAKDAAFSIMRAKTHKSSQMAQYVTTVKSAEVVDDNTLKITATGPSAILLDGLVMIAVVPQAYVEKVGDNTFASQPIGTGPYKLVEWKRGEYCKLEAYDKYWGPKPEFTKVKLRPIPDGATRVAALLTGEIQVAETIGADDVPRVEQAPDLFIGKSPSVRVIYLTMPWPKDAVKGMIEPKDKNPFADVRVRKAIAMGINEDDIIKFVMGGFATPATQYVHPNTFGYNPDVKRPPFDPEGAKKLLAEAGYPNGLKVRLDAPNDRYINDRQIAEAIAGQLKKIGVELTVNAVPKSVFFPQMDKGDFSMYLAGWGTANMSASLNAQVHTRSGNLGVTNRNRYSNAQVDQLIEKGDITFDDAARAKMYQEAVKISQDDVNWVALHLEQLVDGVNKAIDWQPRFDESIFAFEMKRKA